MDRMSGEFSHIEIMEADNRKIQDLELPDENEEIAEIEIDRRGEVLPDRHDKIIIVDADTLAFAACIVCEYEIDILDEEQVDKLKYKWTFDPNIQTAWDINIDHAVIHAKDKLELILENIGGKLENTELHFTGGKTSFRYDLLTAAFPEDPDMHYKAKRVHKRSPVGLAEVKERLIDMVEDRGFIHEEYEADDAVVFRKKELGDDAILVAVDKDVLGNTIGKHWNYYDMPKYNISMKWVEVTEEEANYNQYLQAIIGDKSDNVPGLHGVGKKTAEKFITMGMSEEELWDGLLLAYLKKCKYGDPEDMAILNMRLVNMHQLTDKGIVLWTPPK